MLQYIKKAEAEVIENDLTIFIFENSMVLKSHAHRKLSLWEQVIFLKRKFSQ